MTNAFKITFNKPAQLAFFEGEDASGLKINLSEESLVLTPARRAKGSDVVPLHPRSRGGLEAVIDGSMTEDLKSALHNPDGPFFILQRRKGGSLAVVPWGRSEAPPKFTPHLRVWMDRPECFAVDSYNDFPSLIHQLRNAKEIVNQAMNEKRPGRPTKEVAEAKKLLRSFTELAEDFTIA